MTKSAAQARQDAGFSLAEAARRARVCSVYLRRIELHGNAPYVLATRLAHLYGCSTNLFLHTSPAANQDVDPVANKQNKGLSRRPQPLPDGRKPSATRRSSSKRVEKSKDVQPRIASERAIATAIVADTCQRQTCAIR